MGDSHAVCVRLCDGSFFPLNGRDSCDSECPGTKTQVYYLGSGSDQIDSATTSAGERYADLPVAFRYRTIVDKTCACNSSAIGLANDRTLRNGDLVMTAAGVRVFRSAHRTPYVDADFVDIAQAALPRDRQDALMAMRP